MSSVINDNDTITAIATPLGEAGIGIIRISGIKSLEIGGRIFLGKNGIKLQKADSYTAHYGFIVDNRRNLSGAKLKDKVIDEVILTVMRAPRTYTREDIIEISCHGGIVILNKILNLVINCGARLANPGEFTQRAFLNGRIDLMQAEAVLNIVKAKTDAALPAAMCQLQGRLSERINILRGILVEVAAPLEVGIDFPDEDVNILSREDIVSCLRKAAGEVKALVDSAEKGIILQNGVSLVISGTANTGKSSIMNALLDYERVIVTHISGTTRDVVEETVIIDGVPVRIADTAGIMDSSCVITQKSIDRSFAFLEKADLVLFVLDNSRKISKSDLDVARKIENKKVIIAINKIDLKSKLDISSVKKILPKSALVKISALKKQGLRMLEKAIVKMFFSKRAAKPGLVLISNLRQKEALLNCHRFLLNSISLLKERGYDECLVFEIRQAIEALDELAGKNTSGDILDNIFSRFCIGK